MRGVLRYVGAVAAGVGVTVVLAVAVEVLSAVVHPFPEGFTGTHEEVCRHVESFPAWMLGAAVVAWGVTAFAGTWTAGRLGNRWCALLLGVLILSMLILNISMLPYPIWFKVGSVVVIVAGIVGGYRLSSGRAAAAGSGAPA